MTIIQLADAQARATAAVLDPIGRYAGPDDSREEIIAFSNANAYEWGDADACVRHGVARVTPPDGWAYAWLEYTRRNTSRMSIQAAFIRWGQQGTLPGLD